MGEARHNGRIRFLSALALVSLGAALFAVAFRSTLSVVYRSFYGAHDVVGAFVMLPAWARLLVPVAGGAVAGAIARVQAAPAQGVSNVMEAVALGNIRLSLRATVSRAASSWTAIASGLSIGREGPLIEVGGAMGASVGRRLDLSLDHTRVLVAAGTAAGFAAAYNTPFAAVLFVLETIVGIAAPMLLMPAMATTAVATIVTRAVVGPGPLYGQRAFSQGPATDLLWFAALGAVAVVAAHGFKSTLRFFELAFARSTVPQPFRAMAGGAVVGAIAIAMPHVVGNGYEPINELLDAPVLAYSVGLLLVAKVLATSASVGSGVPGGIFTPTLLVGASVGTMVWQVSAVTTATPHSAGTFALVGMAAATAASIHAPLTAAVMIFEVSGDYAIVLPLIVATVVATSVSRALGSESVYEAELRRRGLGWDLTLEGRQVRSPGRDGPGRDLTGPGATGG